MWKMEIAKRTPSEDTQKIEQPAPGTVKTSGAKAETNLGSAGLAARAT
jgi:hypothetical protein